MSFEEKTQAVAAHGDMTTNPFIAHQKEDDEEASVGDDSMEELHEHKVIPVDDGHGHMAHYPKEDENEPHGKHLDEKEKAKAPHSVIGSALESFKYLYSVILLFFAVSVVMAGIFTKQTNGTADMGVPPAAAFIIFWFLICWLAMMEGGQGALVGLQPIDKSRYADSHPRSLKCTTLAHNGDNMERFIVGRQFLVVFVVFVVNMMGSSVKNANVFNLNDITTKIFLENGVAMILTTLMIGQLTAQVNAAGCQLDFINNYFMLFTTYVSLAIEKSGLLHSVYLVQILFSKITGKAIDTNEPPKDAFTNLLFWARVLMSLVVLMYAFAVTLAALFQGKTNMWGGVPEWVSIVLLFALMAFVGMMEGMQIALFAVVNMPEEELTQHTIAHKNCQLTFTGQNLQAFLIGRQICVTCCMFIVARITSVSVDIDAGEENIFGVSNGLQNFFNTGLLGAIITTIVGSLIWRIIASSFPVAFLSNPLIYFIIRLCLLLEKSGICSAAWVLARYHKPLVNYQPDEVHLEGAEPHTSAPVTRKDKDIDRLVTVIKFTYSLGLLVFAIVLVMAGIFSEKTNGTADMGIPSIVAFIVFWFLLCWLAMMEGGQGALVGLQPIDKTKYAESHPRTLLNTALAHKGDNMERFIVGRQFLVVLVVFVTNMMGSAVKDATVLGLPHVVSEIFLATGLAMILVTIMVGQLTAQVNAANCMLDFLNNYFMLFTTYTSLAIEMSGLLHSVYLVQIVFSKITGKPIDSKEAPRTAAENFFFWARVLMSLAVLGYAFAVTLAALFQGKTAMWEGVPEWVSVIVFFILMCFVGLMEGMQIALFAVVNMPEEELKSHPIAYANCELTFRDQNLQAFLIGRQICVTCCMFVVARITSVSVDIDAGEGNIFGVSDGVQSFFNTGLLGAVITTIVASLAWRIIASSFSLAFLSNPLIYLIIRLCLILEASGVCSAAWVLGRWNKLVAGYQPDEVYLENAEKHTSKPVTRRDKDIDVTVTALKFLYSMVLLVFSVAIVLAAIFEKQTPLSRDVSPVLAFIMIWFLIIWLAMMEGGQGCLIGLQPVDKELYETSHPKSLKCTQLAHKGDNMERFIVGRQFLVVLVVFATNQCGSAIKDASVGLSDTLTEIFLASGVAMIMMTLVLGQLTAQVNAANCMLDFINNYFMLFTTYVSLAIEASGLLHSVYLVQIFFSKITGKPIESSEPPRTGAAELFFWVRVLVSLAILGYAFAVTLSALFNGQTTMYEGVPEVVSVIILFILMAFVGMMEGMQIALFAVVNLPPDELKQYKIASANCELCFSGNNLGAFLIGRQICVTCCMFIVARITTLNIDTEAGDPTVFGVSDGVQAFFNTGLLGAIITTLVASLAWRIIASSFPVAFLSNPLIYFILRLTLLLEASGLCSSAWLLALIHKSIVGYQLDEVYIGTKEERAAAKKGNDDLDLDAEEVDA